MPIYRVINSISPEASSKMSAEYNGYSLLTCEKENDIIWKSVKPPFDLLCKQAWYKPFTFFDPNEINQKMGLPPNYVALERGKDIVTYIKSLFTISKIIKNDPKDFCFEGEYNAINSDKNKSK